MVPESTLGSGSREQANASLVAQEGSLRATAPNPTAHVRPVESSGSGRGTGHDQLEFLWNIHGHTTEYVRFADSKAAFCVAFSGAALGALLNAHAHDLSMQVAFLKWTLLAWLSLCALLLLISSAFCALVAIRPILWARSEEGIVFWENIAEYASPEALASDVHALGGDQLTNHASDHLYLLAKVCRGKYRYVDLAVVTGALGGFLGALVILLKAVT
jgi:hypothetical protein